MLMPSIFGENLFDDFMDGFPFGGYRNTSSFNNLMKTDIRDTDQGYELDITDKRLHHEIYLSDARKVAPEKLKTVIRHPIKVKGS